MSTNLYDQMSMYSPGGPQLSTFSTAEKHYAKCVTHSMNKEHFYFKTRMTYCSSCLIEKQIKRGDCMDSRKFCAAMMHRFTTLMDNATCMPVEHIQKEKEYGIPWRSAFKVELYQFSDHLFKLLVNKDESFPKDEDPFIFFH